MSASFAVFLAAHGLAYVADENGVKQFDNPFDDRLGGIEQFVAWGVVFVTLIVLADFGGGMGELAANFSWLLLLAMLFSYGIGAFGNLQALMGEANGRAAASSSDTSRTSPATGKRTGASGNAGLE
jgi:hypothetical protein